MRLKREAGLLAAVILLAGLPLAAPGRSLGGVRGNALQEESSPDAPRMTVDELKEKLAKHEPITIIDSRSEGSYEESDKKIVGAIRIPLDQIEAHMKDLKRDGPILVYCS